MQENIGNSNYPQHVAVIMDGNNRWATKKKLPGIAGHQEGVRKARELVEIAVQKKIKILTIFAFSSENWDRSKEEVSLLMELLAKAIEEEVPNLIKNSVEIKFVGDLDKFDANLRSRMKDSELRTKSKDKQLDLVVAVGYGGRWDILEAVKKMNNSATNIGELTEESFSKYLSLGELKDPDLCIRTGGEIRISNFLLWQSAYTEFYFTDSLWPDFSRKDFEAALEEYSNRKRNFGNKSNFLEET